MTAHETTPSDAATKRKVPPMPEDRYWRLMQSQTLELTPEEIADGWHFCPEFDGLLCIAGRMAGVIKECNCDKD